MKKIVLRESVFDDLELFHKWELDSDVHQYFSIEENQSYEEVCRKYFEDESKESSRQYTICFDDGTPIGRIVLGDIIRGWKGEIWRIYIGDTALRNKGYGRQALLAVMKYCFEELELQRVYLDHYTGNPAGYLYQKVGFQYEGVLRGNCRKGGVLHDVHLMSMMKDEYESLYKQEL